MDFPAFDEAPMTWAILVLTVAVSVYAFSRPSVLDRLIFDVGAILRRKEDDRLVTSGFLHGDVLHMLVNMLTLISFGPALDDLPETAELARAQALLKTWQQSDSR